MVALTPAELDDFLRAAFPESDVPYSVTRADDEGVEVRQPYERSQLRPGGTLSGPTLMALADTTAYVAVVSQIWQ